MIDVVLHKVHMLSFREVQCEEAARNSSMIIIFVWNLMKYGNLDAAVLHEF